MSDTQEPIANPYDGLDDEIDQDDFVGEDD